MVETIKKLFSILYIIAIKIKHIIYREHDTNRLIIIKVDAIGDYIIFRNFLQAIANSAQYKDHKITLVGNVLLQPLITELDSNLIDTFIYIDHNPEKKDWNKLIREVNQNRYNTLINFNRSRTPTTELISFAAPARKKITIKGDNLRIKPIQKLFFNLMYSLIIDNPVNIESEFKYNAFFTERLIDAELTLNAPVMQLVGYKYKLNVPDEKFIAIAPAAAVANRQLSNASLNKVVEFLLEKAYTICFIGSKADLPLINNLIDQVPTPHSGKIINLAGQIPLNELPYVLNKSLGVICNDSGIYHMGLALNKPVLCFAGGGHFDRFVNYVKRDNVKICYEPMPCYNCNWHCVYEFDLAKPYPCIDAIKPDTIYQNIILLEQQWGITNGHKEMLNNDR